MTHYPFFKENTRASVSNSSDSKVQSWWDNERKPQKNQVENINIFFSSIAKEKNLDWHDGWLDKSLDELEEESATLKRSVRCFRQPYAVARFHKDYVSESILEFVIEKYCYKYFYIYRIHSSNNKLVRDVLRFNGNEDEIIFCEIFQYTNHIVDHVSDYHWTCIKRFKGNLLLNNSCLNIIASSIDFDHERGPEYSQIVLPRFTEHPEREGILLTLAGESHNPLAVPLVIHITKISNILPEDMMKYVGIVESENDKDSHEIELIRDKLQGRYISKTKPEVIDSTDHHHVSFKPNVSN